MRNEMMHYGILRKSGRYPWGSGEDAYRRSKDFYAYVDELKTMLSNDGVPKKHLDREVAKLIGEAVPDGAGYSISNLRDTRTIAKEELVAYETHTAKKLKNKDWSDDAIGTHLGISSATVRLRLKDSEDQKKSSLRNTADVLRKNVDEFDIVDIGKGVGHWLGISVERLRAAASVLRDEGYETHNIKVRQPGTDHNTNQLVMVKPGVTRSQAQKMSDRIHTMGEWTENDGQSFYGIQPPLSISRDRIKFRYAEDGGAEMDGVIQVRPGVPDLDMGKNTYAQVRIKVDDSHYLKGMAVTDPRVPAGYDLVFNTPKSRSDGPEKAMKPLTEDPDLPFGSVISRQILKHNPKTGKDEVSSALNLLREEGAVAEWRKSLPSQMLAKQPQSLIKEQLGVTRKETRQRLDEINAITNPVIRKKKLADYADQIDSDAVELRAAAMPHQKTAVILPVPKMSDREVYAPGFETGERVVLIRFPHGGRFEIPELIVNNNVPAAKRLLKNAADAVGLNSKVAERLSGADFDGDTVLVIPNPKGKIKGLESAPSQYEKKLKDFNPKELYGGYKVVGTRVKKDGTEEEVGNFPLMKNTGREMGMITNLITDMSVQGADADHVIRAVKHSMVVIDAEKHKLNYKQSEIDNNIRQLRALYQTTPGKAKPGGATTLLSKATSKERRPEMVPRPMRDGGPVDEKTGATVMVPSGRMRSEYDKTTRTYSENKVPVTKEYRKLSLTDDAFTLVRDPKDPVEKLYAEHANAMKSLANEARLQALKTPNPKYNPEAKKVYKDEIDKLAADLKTAEKQKPLDRRARNYAGITIKQKMAEDPLLRDDRDLKKKVERQAVDQARKRLGLEKPVIEITDRQWDAIQSRGVSASLLTKILEYADPKRVEELSMPRKNTVMTGAVIARAKAMLAAGATNADVAAALGIPASTLREAGKRGEL